MAEIFKYYVVSSSDKLEQISQVKGNLIYDTEERCMYLDIDNETRLSFQAIITLATDLQRVSLSHPVKGFYFVKENYKLWRHDEDGWFEVASGGSGGVEQIIFRPIDSIPPGTEIDSNKLYVDGADIYRYLNGRFEKCCASKWSEM